jgi:hypothetical protein
MKKTMMVQLAVTFAFGLFAFHVYGADTAAGYARDCSKMEPEKKARCERVNNAMSACAGKKAGDELNNCLKENKGKK